MDTEKLDAGTMVISEMMTVEIGAVIQTLELDLMQFEGHWIMIISETIKQ